MTTFLLRPALHGLLRADRGGAAAARQGRRHGRGPRRRRRQHHLRRRGAGNFLTKLTTASAIIFMCTSLSLAYLGTQEADVQLFDDDNGAERSTVPGRDTQALTRRSRREASGEGDLEERRPGRRLGGLEEIDPGESGGEKRESTRAREKPGPRHSDLHRSGRPARRFVMSGRSVRSNRAPRAAVAELVDAPA